MLKQLKTISKMTRIMRKGDHIGDVPVLKMTLFMDREAKSIHSEQALQMRSVNFTDIDPTHLEQLSKDSFGYAYAQFMLRHELHPFNFSSDVEDLFERYPITFRYVRLHDMIHTLLGFDTSIAGELGVYAFVGEQHYTGTLDWAARVARNVAVLPFWQRKKLIEAQKRGKTLAEDASILICEPLESLFEVPLVELRQLYLPCFDQAPLRQLQPAA